MSVVPITIAAIIYPKNKTDAPYPATIVGYAWVTGLQVGGGPILPPPGSGGMPPHPSHPIVEIPSHPIVLPPEQPEPPEIPSTPSEPKPPPADGGWGWSPDYGWGYFPAPGQPTPKR